MKPTKKARVVKPQSKKKIRKPLSKSTSTLSKLEDTGKNFYEAGKEVASKGTDLLKQISAVPEKGLSEVVKMAIKAEQDAAYGRKVVMILGMILSTLMFLFTRLGQDYGFEDKTYDKKISLPYGYGIVGDGKYGPTTIQIVKKEFDNIPIRDPEEDYDVNVESGLKDDAIAEGLSTTEANAIFMTDKAYEAVKNAVNAVKNILAQKVYLSEQNVDNKMPLYQFRVSLNSIREARLAVRKAKYILSLRLNRRKENNIKLYNELLMDDIYEAIDAANKAFDLLNNLKKYSELDIQSVENAISFATLFKIAVEEAKTAIEAAFDLNPKNTQPNYGLKTTQPNYGLKTTQHSVWSVAASALALTLFGRAAFMNKKEQFYYFVDFIIAFLVCSVVYFILVGIFGKKGDKDAFITNDSFFEKKDAAAAFAVGTYNKVHEGLFSVFTSENALEKAKADQADAVTANDMKAVNKANADQAAAENYKLKKDYEAIPKSDITAKDYFLSKNKITLDELNQISPNLEYSPHGGKKKKKRSKTTKGGLSTEINPRIVFVTLTGVLAAIVLISEKRRNFFSERLNTILQYIKANVSSKN